MGGTDLGGGPAGVTRDPSGPPASGQSSQLGSCRSGFYSWTLLTLTRMPWSFLPGHMMLTTPNIATSSLDRPQAAEPGPRAGIQARLLLSLTPTLSPSPRRAMVPPNGLLLLPVDSLSFLPASTHPHPPPHPPAKCRHSAWPEPCSFSPFHLPLTSQHLPPTPIPADTQAAPTSVSLPLPLL